MLRPEAGLPSIAIKSASAAHYLHPQTWLAHLPGSGNFTVAEDKTRMVLPVLRRSLELRKRSALRRVPPDMDTFRGLTVLNSYLMDGLEIVSYNSRGVSEFLAKQRCNSLTDTVAEGLGPGDSCYT